MTPIGFPWLQGNPPVWKNLATTCFFPEGGTTPRGGHSRRILVSIAFRPFENHGIFRIHELGLAGQLEFYVGPCPKLFVWFSSVDMRPRCLGGCVSRWRWQNLWSGVDQWPWTLLMSLELHALCKAARPPALVRSVSYSFVDPSFSRRTRWCLSHVKWTSSQMGHSPLKTTCTSGGPCLTSFSEAGSDRYPRTKGQCA